MLLRDPAMAGMQCDSYSTAMTLTEAESAHLGFIAKDCIRNHPFGSWSAHTVAGYCLQSA